MTDPVKTPRRYDASLRRSRARMRQQKVLDVAREMFLRDGYAATTVAAIATTADVSVETIYKTFGGKPGLIREIQAAALTGTGPVPAPQRSDHMSASEPDPEVVLRNWATLATEVAPAVTPIIGLVRDAAATDPDMASLLDDINTQRLARMTHNARRLRSHLPPTISLEHARDVLFTYTAPEIYELLVLARHWSVEQYAEFIYRGMATQLLPPSD
ncbi:possible transcriptional regulator, TetR family protein (plasmid) [Rhodococcus jostii RHA1]|uniref:Possible transcriptional regulator, TetR family protein n=2 Tax=Rhodococcus TaxID=1827 RepID=Q0RZ60_RHOJR|nr:MULTISPECIES: TetR/AcrR family transcriptional regulator [Rhodococcus]ABG99426.1 possible transcriptional regulator, TetR family protein [Rhodococcus jostii RHA1]QQZ19123.1 TetR/AcrR family transcriptional regulator [Rhodococcus sp. 21391]